MIIYASSDFHGQLPDPKQIPECDLFLIGGDVTPLENHDRRFQLRWLDAEFRAWLHQVQERVGTIVGIAGNHDFVFEQRQLIDTLYLPWIYLCDESVTVGGLKIYGIPWVPNLPRWAFHQKKEGLKEKYDAIPKDTDIVLSHGPPHGYGDRLNPSFLKASEGYNPHAGAKSATDMLERVKPKAFVSGHIHEAFGHYPFMYRDLRTNTDIYNVSYVDETYVARGQIVEVTIDVPEDQANEQRQVCGEDSDTRSSSESSA